MILDKYQVKALCEAPALNPIEARLVLLNYIYHTKSVVDNRVMSAEITNIARFESMMTIACAYFLNLP